MSLTDGCGALCLWKEWQPAHDNVIQPVLTLHDVLHDLTSDVRIRSEYQMIQGVPTTRRGSAWGRAERVGCWTDACGALCLKLEQPRLLGKRKVEIQRAFHYVLHDPDASAGVRSEYQVVQFSSLATHRQPC